jgi:hypothetical protein
MNSVEPRYPTRSDGGITVAAGVPMCSAIRIDCSLAMI